MPNKNNLTNDTADRELSISRLLNAPVDLVYKVWTDPEHIAKWWGPNGFTNTIHKMELIPGGTWDFVMHGPDGTDYRNTSIYREIITNEKIVFTHETGPKFTMTITFTPQDNKTLLTIQMLFNTAAELDKVQKEFRAGEGLKQNMDKLHAYLSDMEAA